MENLESGFLLDNKVQGARNASMMSVDFTLNYDLNIDFMFLMGFNQRLKGNGVLRQKATEIEQPVLIQLLPE